MPSSAQALDELSFLAARDGLEAQVPTTAGGSACATWPMRLSSARGPHARALGSEPELEGLAASSRAATAPSASAPALADGGPEAVLELLARETAQGRQRRG